MNSHTKLNKKTSPKENWVTDLGQGTAYQEPKMIGEAGG